MIFLLLVLVVPVLLFGEMTEEVCARRILAHLLIGDVLSGIREAKEALQIYPDSKPIQTAYFRALCAKGDEVEACALYEKIASDGFSRPLLETLAWGVLNKGRQSTQLPIRLNALLGVSFTQDARAIPILREEMRSSNAILRSFAVHLAGNFGDIPLQEELVRLFREEQVWFVRLEVIQAIGRLNMLNMREPLQEILTHPKSSLEEKSGALVALVSMYESISPQELSQLIQSNRAGLRQLACEVVAHLDLGERTLELLPLLKDSSPEVRVSVLNTLGLLQVASAAEEIKGILDDSAPEVAMTAAWAIFPFYPKLAAQKLKEWLRDPNPEHRRLAAGALAVSGMRGTNLAWKILKETEDPYVKITLAMGLIAQRQHLALASETINRLLSQENKTLWMWDRRGNPLFRTLAPSRLRHVEQIPHYPKVVDQMVRLELLSTLCLAGYSKAVDAVKDFLTERTWGVTGTAAALLLQEGDETSLDVVRQLLQEPDEKIRVQAALICAVLGEDLSAAAVLQEVYPRLDREMRLRVLEALAHVGDPRCIPFLVAQLKEPFQVLRVAAASALIQCLYH